MSETDTRKVVPIKLRPSVVERARAAVFWTEGLTLSELVENAMVREVRRLERSRGAPFPEREGALKSSGRPANPPKPKRPPGRPRKRRGGSSV